MDTARFGSFFPQFFEVHPQKQGMQSQTSFVLSSKGLLGREWTDAGAVRFESPLWEESDRKLDPSRPNCPVARRTVARSLP